MIKVRRFSSCLLTILLGVYILYHADGASITCVRFHHSLVLSL